MNDLTAWLDQHHISVVAVLATIAVVIGAFVISHSLKRPMRESLRQLAPRLHLPY
jgi:hypothetical protein